MKLTKESICVQSGHFPYQSHTLPIIPSSTYVFDSAEHGMDIFTNKQKGYIYSRFNNPTVDFAAEKIAALEGFGMEYLPACYLTSSGMSALSTLFLALLKPGDKILSHFSLYGGTDELFHKTLKNLNIETVIIDFDDLEAVENAIKSDSSIKHIHIETPANPTLRCVDIEAVSSIAKKYNLKVSADNTFATPLLQQPLLLGADFVIHSITKYLNGHGTAIGGAVIGKDLEWMDTVFKKAFRLLGGAYNPFEAWLLVNGLKTLPMRLRQHTSNAKALANFLSKHPKVASVNYLGLEQHTYHQIAKKQMEDFGGMMSFELKDGFEAGVKFLNKLELCVRAVSLGTCDTLVSHPASMTHIGVDRAERIKYGISDGLIRLSVGIENINDILADFEQALNA
jgi:methionine-gamma-lyase